MASVTCTFCGAIFVSSDELKRHVTDIHSDRVKELVLAGEIYHDRDFTSVKLE